MSNQDSDSSDNCRLIIDFSNPASEKSPADSPSVAEAEPEAIPVVQPVVQPVLPVVQPEVQPVVVPEVQPEVTYIYIYEDSSDETTSQESPVIPTVMLCHHDCDYKTTNGVDFDNHIANVHDDYPENSWVCPKPGCKFRYTESINLKNHKERFHPITEKPGKKRKNK
jgi:hypothetical protein